MNFATNFVVFAPPSLVFSERGRLQSATFPFSFPAHALGDSLIFNFQLSTVNCQLSTDQFHAARSSQSSQCCREDGHHHLDDVPPEILVLHNDKQTLSVLRTSPPWRGRAVRFVGHFVLKVNTWFGFSLGTF